MTDVVKGFSGVCTFCGVIAVSVVAAASLAILIWTQLL